MSTMWPPPKPVIHRNYVATGGPCDHCGHWWRIWLCPSGMRCCICCDCAGVVTGPKWKERHPHTLGPVK
jgi:hypothetical protein